MKKTKTILIGLLGSTMVLATSACGGHQLRIKAAVEDGAYATASIPVKDFEPISLVFAKSDFKAGNGNSPALLYHSLMVKAHELGAHDIINVKIESVTNCEKADKKSDCITTRYGSALAIKYTHVLENSAPVASQAATIKDDSGWQDVE